MPPVQDDSTLNLLAGVNRFCLATPAPPYQSAAQMANNEGNLIRTSYHSQIFAPQATKLVRSPTMSP
jgi:hypothetical protein